MWVEVTKLPMACPSLNLGEIYHKLEYQNIENTFGEALASEFMFSSQFYDFVDNMKQQEEDVSIDNLSMEYGSDPSEVSVRI